MDRSALLVRVLEQESELAALRATVRRYGRALNGWAYATRPALLPRAKRIEAAHVAHDELIAAQQELKTLALALAAAP